MDLKIITDYDEAKQIFTMGQLTDDGNRNNYSVEQFEKSWKKWINFYVLYEGDQVVCFCGIRIFPSGYGRIFDRYFIEPYYRNWGLKHKEYSTLMVERLVQDCVDNNLIPFFSIQDRRKRRALVIAVKKFNKYLKNDYKFHTLDGLYNTAGNSWQNIAVQYPHDINLPRKDITQ